MTINETLSQLKNQTNNDKLFFILGPCAIESEIHSLKIAEYLKKLSEQLNFTLIFKSSFDKANRTSLGNYRGVGIDEGLKILEKIRNTFNVPTITDVHESSQAQIIADVVDILQVPAFLCRQTDLLIAIGKTQKLINVKKGQFVAPETMEKVIEKIESTGNKNIWLCERGYTFGYNNLIVDYRNFPIMKNFGKPLVFDATHSVQRPSGQGGTSGGDRWLAPYLATAAISQGIAGLFFEVHDVPEQALCDGPNCIRLSQLEALIKHCINHDAWVKANPLPEIS